MNPRSIILASGTLHPLESFEAELQVPFLIKLKNSHVIDPSQVLIQSVKAGENELVPF